MKIKKGDKVIVIAGKNKGKVSLVKKVIKEKNSVILDGVNLLKKHQKPNQKNPDGGIISIEGKINVSNVMILTNEKEGKASRIGYKNVNDKKIRVYKKTGGEIK